jgi:hypothetical protein
MRLLRVFPRRTAATPDDDLVRIGFPDLFPPECDEIHVSVTFTYDLPKAERMAEAWRHIAPTYLGGPAHGDPGDDFIPGRYLKQGYVITSRGCPNRCWFCMAAKREGDIRELPIFDGWNILDNNLLACSPDHIYRVFEMLSRQARRAEFTGGLEAARLTTEMARRLTMLKPKRIYFAYDTPNDKEPLAEAARMLWGAGMKPSSHIASAYVLIGYPHDSFSAADDRLRFVASLGIMPFAMLYRDEAGKVDQSWRRFQREWCRPSIVGTKMVEARA